MAIYSGAAHHKRSANSRSRKKSPHNQGRKPRYKDAAVAAAHGQVCDTCDAYKTLPEFYRTFPSPLDRSEWCYRSTCKSCCLEYAQAQKEARISAYYQFVDSYRAIRAAPYVPVPLAQLLTRRRGWTQANWSQQDHGDLKVLCLGDAPIDSAADSLGRTPYAVAYRARERGLQLPAAWSLIVAPKRVIKPRTPRFILKYPYIAKARPSDDDLVRVNNLVPHGFPDWVRADIAQSVLLAFYEGNVSIAELEANRGDLRWFYKKYYREQEPREEVQMSGASDDDTRPHDEIATSQRYYQTLERHEEASQIEYVWKRELTAARFIMSGKVANLRDVDGMLERGEIKIGDLQIDLFRPWDRVRKHARIRLKERFGIELDRQQAEALINYCRQRSPDDRDRQRELHLLRSRGRPDMPIVYDRRVNEVISVLPKGQERLGGSAL